MKRRIIAIALAACSLLHGNESAAFVVVDAASVAQLAAQVVETTNQIEVARRQVEAFREAARRLDPRSYQSIQSLLDGNAVNFRSLLWDVRSMGYTVDAVNARYHQLFPDDKKISTMNAQQQRQLEHDMNQELHSAALLSARAQSTVIDIDRNNVEARNIMSRSAGSGGQVAQMQSALQMLALVHDNLARITQTMATASRVSTDKAAMQVTQERLQTERRRRLLEGYAQPAQSPGIDRRFLR